MKRHRCQVLLAGTITAWLLLSGCTPRTGFRVGEAGEDKPGTAQPYAGMEGRAIRALSPERVADLLAGRGAGYALAAELNQYPGPLHVLEARDALRLTPEQERLVREVYGAMHTEARRLGAHLVALEAELDRVFRSETITPEALSRLTTEIAAIEGQLRRTHLAAHLELKAVLTPEQIARYDALRGYTDHGEQSGQQHKGHGGSHGS